MNPQTYHPNPTPTPQPPAPQQYGAGATNRAMLANRQLNPQPVVINQPQPVSNPVPAQPVAGVAPAQMPPQMTQQMVQQMPQTGQPIMQPAMMPATTPVPSVVETPISTQATLQFSELRDSLVIMKDGSFRAVVACQSINFDLMSEQERESVEYSYQNFLNSLNFTVQILVRSQRVDIAPYIERLVKLRRDNDNMLLGVLMDDYINFIDVLAQEANIMDKSFFIVIPYYSTADMERAVQQTKNFIKAFSKNNAPSPVTRINRDTYNKAIDELNNRVETVISGLFQIGIQSVRLNTRELSQLFYNFNNPDTAVREPLVDFSKLATMYVKKGVKE